MLLRIGAATCLAFSVWHSAVAQDSKVQNDCHGLHAGITAQLTEGYSDPSVMVGFILLNDSESIQDTAPESWEIVIDGKVLKESDWILGNGPMPVGGYGKLAVGANYDFGKALPIAQYFPEKREYKVSWKGKYFQSPTVTVKIP
jgi:hypothetical protein